MKKLIRLTVTEAAPQFGISYPTLVSALKKMDVEVGRGKRFPLSVLYKAIAGDLETERIRETRARADLLELERREKERNIITMEECLALIRKIGMSARTRFAALPSEMAARCNPTDPAFARAALDQWKNEAIKMCRDEI